MSSPDPIAAALERLAYCGDRRHEHWSGDCESCWNYMQTLRPILPFVRAAVAKCEDHKKGLPTSWATHCQCQLCREARALGVIEP